MAPSRRAFLAAAAATMAAACTDQAAPDAAPPTVPTSPPATTTPAPAERGAAGGPPAGGLDGKPARVVFAGPRTRRQVALTFHLSGDPARVSRLLDTAARAGVPISLFAVGRWLTEHPTLVQRILADGHELDNHTWSHPMLSRLDGPAVAIEIRRCKAALTQATGSGGRYFRPSGMTSPTPLVLTKAGAAGYPLVVAFDVDPRDYTDPGANPVTARVTAGLRPGSIVSLHTGHTGTITAFDPIVAAARARGLQPVLLHQLLDGSPSGP
jgi:peptidoglycan/xylan/chitin deacetylase (PgdA/CDA1 family)